MAEFIFEFPPSMPACINCNGLDAVLSKTIEPLFTCNIKNGIKFPKFLMCCLKFDEIKDPTNIEVDNK